MTARTRALVTEAAITVGLLTAALYVFYIVAIWGVADRFEDGLFKDYVTGPGIHAELLIMALGFGILLTLVNLWATSPRVRQQSLGRIILLKSAWYGLGMAVVCGTVLLVFRTFVFSPEELSALWSVMSARILITIVLWFALSVLAVNFLLEVRRKVGPGQLSALLTGRYRRPRNEERVFLFLDLKGSTTLAETLGHERYSQLIQQCFHDLTDVVLRSGAEIYQYVGDEVVLTWPADEPDVARLCLETFFGFDQQIVRNRGFYEDRFAVVPKFRGGAEAGEVTVTEVGDIKRDIAYHGDPLNTAARLLELCKTSSSDLLVSGRIHSATSGLSAFASNPQGEVTLRGKAEAVSVYGMSLA